MKTRLPTLSALCGAALGAALLLALCLVAPVARAATPQTQETKEEAAAPDPGQQQAEAEEVEPTPAELEAENRAAEKLFREAFANQTTPPQRVRLLERVVKEHPDTDWADDALWTLGEAARRQHLHRAVVYYWQYLMGRYPEAELEPFTCRQTVYKESRVAAINDLLLREGSRYKRTGLKVQPGQERKSFVYGNVDVIDPLPMLVWEGLGDAYRRLEMEELAHKAYLKSAEAAPTEGRWATAYSKRIEQKAERTKPTVATRQPGTEENRPAAAKREEDGE
jgi:hypothetical protein